jgi:hypothetical protein
MKLHEGLIVGDPDFEACWTAEMVVYNFALSYPERKLLHIDL